MSFTLLKLKRKVCFGLDDLQEGQLITRQQYYSLDKQLTLNLCSIWQDPERENNRYRVRIKNSNIDMTFYVEGVYPYLGDWMSEQREKERLKNLKTT